METKKQEVVFKTADTKQMVGNYTAEMVKRTWKETFIDQSTGEQVEVNRSEKILDKGVYIDEEKASSISFYIQSGDINEILVSNQCRNGQNAINTYPYAYVVTISIRENFKDKNVKLLVLAQGVENAIEIVKDFAELKFTGLFWIKAVKQIEGILLKDTLKKVDKDLLYLKDKIDAKNYITETENDETQNTDKFYSIDVSVVRIDEEKQEENSLGIYSFIIKTQNIDTAVCAIQRYIEEEHTRQRTELDLDLNFKIMLQLEKAVEVKYDEIIDIEFSRDYFVEK